MPLWLQNTKENLIQFELEDGTQIKLDYREFCQVEGKCPFCEE